MRRYYRLYRNLKWSFEKGTYLILKDRKMFRYRIMAAGTQGMTPEYPSCGQE